MKNSYIKLYEVPVNDENVNGFILGFACGAGTDLSKESIYYVLDNCVGRPNSIIYEKKEFDETLKLAKETLEKDYEVIIGL
jgi:hypothetical protein